MVCIADLDPPQDGCGHWHVARINVPLPLRKNGYGSKLLSAITEDADAEHVELCLDPIGSGEMTTKDLIKWYERNGFKRSSGESRCSMIREPNGTEH